MPSLVVQINDVEKGYYADGEDAYDMRLPFAQNESSSKSIKPMTPLKQVVAVNSAAVAKRKEEAPKASTVGAAAREEGKPSGEDTNCGGGGGVGGGGGSAAKGADEASEEAVSKQLEGLSVDGGNKA